MAGVNKRNTGQNFVNAFKNVAAAVEGSRAAMAGADPFSRRQTQSRNYWTTRRNGAPRTVRLGSNSPLTTSVRMPERSTFALLHLGGSGLPNVTRVSPGKINVRVWRARRAQCSHAHLC